MHNPGLAKAVRILFIIILSVVILVYGKPFLMPLTFAALLSMLMRPIASSLERKGANKAVAALLSILVLVSFFALVVFFVSWQVSDLVSDASKIQQQANIKLRELRTYISKEFGIPYDTQKEIIKQQSSGTSGSAGGGSSFMGGFFSGLSSFLGNTILVLVYMFLFLYFRGHLKKFAIQLVPRGNRETTLSVIETAQSVAQKYLTGLSLMIVCLWIMYGIGFTIVGVRSPAFFAILCGLLEIVPFIGNLFGTIITLAMSLVQGGGTSMILGILITYGTIQFIQTYILEPLVVGAEVNLNPLFTIIALIAGELLWGIPGMILAIPLMGIAKIVCDNVESLKPFGYLIGEDKKKQANKGFITKVKGWFKKQAA